VEANSGLKAAELRLALVCYGGVSLAIYMHGVTKELHKLVRASRSFDELEDLEGPNPFTAAGRWTAGFGWTPRWSRATTTCEAGCGTVSRTCVRCGPSGHLPARVTLEALARPS
jgi:hypothetical protein